MELVEKIVTLISQSTGKSREEILEEIKEKEREFAGLVSLEGAAKLVARDYGLRLEDFIAFVPLNELVEGMKNIAIKGRIVKIFPPKEFERKDGSKGRVATIILGDSTGFARLILWDRQTEAIDNKELREGEVIKIYSARTRENIFGGIDIILSRYSSIEEGEEENIPSLEELKKKFEKLKREYERININEVREGFFEIVGMIVHVYRTRNIFYSCPICLSSVSERDGKYICEIDGEVKPVKSLVLAIEVDDGTGTLRAVLFREKAEKLLGVDVEEIEKMDEEERRDFLREKLLGRFVILKGRIKVNKVFGNMEMIVDEVEDLNTQNEIEKLLNRLEVNL